MQLFVFAIGVLALIATWRLMIRKTILDHHRDALFDLRDELRQSFLQHDWDIGSDFYRKLRHIINGYLRYTENFSFMQFTYLESEVKKSPQLQAMLKGEFERNFSSLTPEQMEYATAFRKRALDVMVSYMIVSSGPLAILTVVLVPFVSLYLFARVIQRGFVKSFGILIRKIVDVHDSTQVVFNRTVDAVASKLIVRDLVEEMTFLSFESSNGQSPLASAT